MKKGRIREKRIAVRWSVFLTYCVLSIPTVYATDDPLDCLAASDSSNSNSNSESLLSMSEICNELGAINDAIELQVLAQIRTLTDAELLTPLDDHSKELRARQLSLFHSDYGVIRPRTFLRENENLERLLKNVRTWKPNFNNKYDPGWSYESNVSARWYIKLFDYYREVRLRKLSWDAQLLQDPEYYAAALELQNIEQEIGSDGSKDGSQLARARTLQRAMIDFARRLDAPVLPARPTKPDERLDPSIQSERPN